MKKPKYLSPTSISLFYFDREAFYIRYLADISPPREPQIHPMSVGSAFDAYIKSHLNHLLFGKDMDPRFEFEAIFESQVEKQNRDWARYHGKHVFDAYITSGAAADLMLELQQAAGKPEFEFEVAATIEGIPLLGRPDLYFVLPSGKDVVYDWKVNGYCSRGNTSPKAGYIKIRDSQKENTSRSHGSQHKDAQILMIDGIKVNVATYMELIDESWAAQLSIYNWVKQKNVGQRFIAGIEQVVCNNYSEEVTDTKRPEIRVASHRLRVTDTFQKQLLEKIKFMWEAIHTGHIFSDMPKEDSDARCAMLDERHLAFDSSDPMDEWFTNATNKGKSIWEK